MGQYEFCGPVGVSVLMLALPSTIYALFYACTAEYCVGWQPELGKALAAVLAADPWKLASWGRTHLFSWEAVGVVLAWLAVQALLYALLPGRLVVGTPLADGCRLLYRMNGLLAYVVSLVGVAALHVTGLLDLTYVEREYVRLATAAILLSMLLTVALYAASFRRGAILSPHGNTGSVPYDLFMGRELNPRIGPMFDLKVFCELRPGLIGWCVINLGLALAQAERGGLTFSMALVVVFQLFYVLDSFLSEAALLTTMDVTHEGFGFMLAFGDLAWVPFTYTLQARYLAFARTPLTPLHAAAAVGLNAVAYAIFRGANSQKDAFRTNPSDPAVRHLEYLETARGSKLLVSGWWGIARHINYFGDMLMGLAWCLPCGFDSPVPYFYAVYFVVLLVHRDMRDEAKCALKYGADWDKYCRLVRSRIIPYVY